jgi:flagellar basal body-associated protein FliL
METVSCVAGKGPQKAIHIIPLGVLLVLVLVLVLVPVLLLSGQYCCSSSEDARARNGRTETPPERTPLRSVT